MPNWTKEQEKAIYEPSGKKNILVSAAAGISAVSSGNQETGMQTILIYPQTI